MLETIKVCFFHRVSYEFIYFRSKTIKYILTYKTKQKNVFFGVKTFYVINIHIRNLKIIATSIWRSPSLNELTSMIYNTGLTHLDLKASICATPDFTKIRNIFSNV